MLMGLYKNLCFKETRLLKKVIYITMVVIVITIIIRRFSKISVSLD